MSDPQSPHRPIRPPHRSIRAPQRPVRAPHRRIRAPQRPVRAPARRAPGRRTIGLAAPALVLALGLVAACGVPTDSSATVADRDDVPFDLLDTGTTTTTAPSAGPPTGPGVRLCFVRNDEAVVSVSRARDEIPGTADDLVDVLAAGPTETETQLGLSSALPEPSPAVDVTIQGGVAVVDLDATFSDLSADQQLLAVAQMVCTLTDQPGVGQVRFTLEGERIEVPQGDGALTASPVTRDDYADLILS